VITITDHDRITSAEVTIIDHFARWSRQALPTILARLANWSEP